jgi:hypothetical protein
MKTNQVNTKWVSNLYEAGAPIKDWAREITYRIERANAELAEAQARHAEAMQYVKSENAKLEKKIDSLWTAEEIAAAKRGEMVVTP